MSTPPSSDSILVHRVIARLNVGGPAMHVVNLARALDEGGRFHTELVAGIIGEAEGDMGYYAQEHGVVVHYLRAMSREISLLDDLRSLWSLYRLFRRERPTVVHTHTAKAGTLGRLAALLARVPVRVHTFHGHVLGGSYFGGTKTRLFLQIERQLARATDRLVVLTQRQATEMSEELGVAPREKFAVVPLGLELEPFLALDRAARRAAVRHELGIPEDALVVGYVGRMVPVKNHELWLEAMAALVKMMAAEDGGAPHRARPVMGLVVGSGERQDELKARADALGLQKHLLWMGWRRDLPDLYAAMDVLALTSHDEGTPVAVIEALSAGTPVAARDVGGVQEVLDAVGGGAAVPRGADGVQWAETFRERGDTSVSAETREAVAKQYSVARLTADVAALYTELLDI